ncbi:MULTISPECIES: hypothetical protein [unclassified Variovorax]|uniref:hypothetical protein n=1 Tax=unclassified Variovorax TaxID=663243 RepID=UPI00076CB286|nr:MULTISPECIES: hypothetical protein [unclassified Variovorax]KWT67018.1 hypothetical protein APY03_7126 [Variovorax sp. WDL1]PNG49144.1 hypothetical protein CHC06_06381 [Variovorax sp. B2]PNG49529.1 hypothetical protein CHC07_06438 [Variovorax sp. B4]VTV18831.1 hypothetical protein WDL1P2_00459 [Variovorax sp. WDL1]
MTKKLFFAALVMGLTACIASAQASDEMSDFKKRAEIADFKARTERMIDAVGRESCEEFNAQTTAASFWVCVSGARGTAEDMVRRMFEMGAMLPPANERPEFVDKALYKHCKSALENPFLPNDYSVCKHGVDAAVGIVAKSITAKPKQASRSK